MHLVAWFVLLGIVPAAAALRLRDRWPHAPAALQSFAGPAVFALAWVHGAVFDPPNNFAVLWRPSGGLGFFGFWFNPHRGFEYREHGALMLALAAPIVAVVALGLLRTWRRWRPDRQRPVRAAAGYLSWVLGGLLLRHVGDRVLDLAEHDPYAMESVGQFLGTAGGELALTLGLAAPPILLALWLARTP
jgi:hypothetical protein